MLFNALNTTYRTLLIDFPDDAIKSQSIFKKYIKELEHFWRELFTGDHDRELNIAFATQEELSNVHFFEGKTIQIRLKPIPTEKLVQILKNMKHPFDDESVNLLAFKSGGNVRRLQEFVRRCLLKILVSKKRTISKADVEAWIGLEDVIASLDLQLTKTLEKL